MISKIIYRQGCKFWKTRLPSFIQNLDVSRKSDKSLHRFGKNKWPEFPEGKEVAQNSSSTFKRKSNILTFCVDTLIDSDDCNQSMWLSLVVSPSSKKGQLSSSLRFGWGHYSDWDCYRGLSKESINLSIFCQIPMKVTCFLVVRVTFKLCCTKCQYCWLTNTS